MSGKRIFYTGATLLILGLFGAWVSMAVENWGSWTAGDTIMFFSFPLILIGLLSVPISLVVD